MLLFMVKNRRNLKFLLFCKQLVKFIHKRVDVFELAVNRGEANVGNLVNALDLFHSQLADLRGRDLAVKAALDLCLDRINHCLDLLN